ncbi:hypothetical protein GJ744_000778 [Endocarpon pusillum]|uniref:Uncharacterized protein n=1 Tax=Endocarpon pusillum TaxID=364733 RepID=A0A8H7E3P7_9EURO|nr:hypothetical protein GJ744_000778 [Endocarpon pusillum]
MSPYIRNPVTFPTSILKSNPILALTLDPIFSFFLIILVPTPPFHHSSSSHLITHPPKTSSPHLQPPALGLTTNSSPLFPPHLPSVQKTLKPSLSASNISTQPPQ